MLYAICVISSWFVKALMLLFTAQSVEDITRIVREAQTLPPEPVNSGSDEDVDDYLEQLLCYGPSYGEQGAPSMGAMHAGAQCASRGMRSQHWRCAQRAWLWGLGGPRVCEH